MLLHQPPRATDARRDDARARILLETLRVEHAALAAVEGEYCLVGRESSKCRADDLLAHARRLRVALHLGEEVREATAALRGERRCRHNRGCKRKPGSAKACHHETGAHPLTSLSSRRVHESAQGLRKKTWRCAGRKWIKAPLGPIGSGMR